jgi:hypothetical protein
MDINNAPALRSFPGNGQSWNRVVLVSGPDCATERSTKHSTKRVTL